MHIVAAGDTVGSIARAFGVSVPDILAANEIPDPNALLIGQQIVIPPTAGTADAALDLPPLPPPTDGTDTTPLAEASPPADSQPPPPAQEQPPPATLPPAEDPALTPPPTEDGPDGPADGPPDGPTEGPADDAGIDIGVAQ